MGKNIEGVFPTKKKIEIKNFILKFAKQSGSQGSESVQYFHNDLSRAILVSIITSISQIPIMVPLSVYVSELLPVLQ